jgi:hypothetical protein
MILHDLLMILGQFARISFRLEDLIPEIVFISRNSSKVSKVFIPEIVFAGRAPTWNFPAPPKVSTAPNPGADFPFVDARRRTSTNQVSVGAGIGATEVTRSNVKTLSQIIPAKHISHETHTQHTSQIWLSI